MMLRASYDVPITCVCNCTKIREIRKYNFLLNKTLILPMVEKFNHIILIEIDLIRDGILHDLTKFPNSFEDWVELETYPIYAVVIKIKANNYDLS